MFGYVIANKEIMTEEQSARYKASYCGLCRALKSRCGSVSRMTLTYDMTFLILLLSSMYEYEEETGEERCIPHPVKSHQWRRTEVTDYAADMNLALAYLNLMDDWKDDKNLLKLTGAGLLSEQYFYIKQRYPEKCASIEALLCDLSALESANDMDADAASRLFGGVMAEVFDYKLDTLWGDALRGFGQSLGELVYIMDAVCDLEGDVKKGRYNPLRPMYESGRRAEDMRPILTMLAAECAARFERLPLVRDADIARNVLYSGVWLRYNARVQSEKGKGASADERPL